MFHLSSASQMIRAPAHSAVVAASVDSVANAAVVALR